VYTVEVDGEAVLLDERTGRLHLLNATGALVWACFDGASSLGEIVSDLSDGLGAPRDVVLADVMSIARHLGDEGLLANVEPRHVLGTADAAAEPSAQLSDDARFLPEPPNP
jgi:hypothetical protein